MDGDLRGRKGGYSDGKKGGMLRMDPRSCCPVTGVVTVTRSPTLNAPTASSMERLPDMLENGRRGGGSAEGGNQSPPPLLPADPPPCAHPNTQPQQKRRPITFRRAIPREKSTQCAVRRPRELQGEGVDGLKWKGRGGSFLVRLGVGGAGSVRTRGPGRQGGDTPLPAIGARECSGCGRGHVDRELQKEGVNNFLRPSIISSLLCCVRS